MTSGPGEQQHPQQPQWQPQPQWQQAPPQWQQQQPQPQPQWQQAPPQWQQQPPPSPPPRRRRTGLWVTLGILATVLVVGGGAAVGLVINDQNRYDPLASLNEEAIDDPNSVAVTKKDVQALLEGHGKALTAGDLKAYTAVFDQKNTALVQRQTRTFNNLRKLPLTQMSYQVLASVQTLGQKGRAQDSFGRGVTLDVDVAFVHQFEGIDVLPVSEWYRWTVNKATADAPLKITKVGGAPAPYGESKTVYYPGPWDIWPDITVAKTEHAIVMAPPSMAALAERMAPIAERTAVSNLEFLAKNGVQGNAIPKGFVVGLVKGKAQLGNLFRKSEAHEAGVSIPMIAWNTGNGGAKVGGSRVVMDTSTSFFETARGTEEIFLHEFAHSAFASLELGSGDLDNWVVEGFAEYVANRDRPITADIRYQGGRAFLAGRLPSRFEGKLPDNADWDLESMTSVNYLMGHLAMRLIAEKYGEPKLLEFVAAHYRGDGSDKALQEVLGISGAQFQRQWANYVRLQLG